MGANLDEIRGLLIYVFHGESGFEEELMLHEKEDILKAANLQNEVLNHSINHRGENFEARLSHLNFYYNFNIWFIAFEKEKL